MRDRHQLHCFAVQLDFTLGGFLLPPSGYVSILNLIKYFLLNVNRRLRIDTKK